MSTTVVGADAQLPVDERFSRTLAALRSLVQRGLRLRLRCLLLEHEDTFAREQRRLRLRCATCGRETVGWSVGPGTSAVIATRPASAGRRMATHDAPVRLGAWTLRPWRDRAEARDRQRQRLVAAARAAEPRVEEQPVPRAVPSRVVGRLLASERPPERWMDVARRVRDGLGG
jgi:hypothetical protein